jgi:hypothetical protein
MHLLFLKPVYRPNTPKNLTSNWTFYKEREKTTITTSNHKSHIRELLILIANLGVYP